MEAKLERQNGRESALSSINKAKDALDLARDVKGTKPAKDAFDSASLLLAAIRQSVIDKADCVELGFICADVCQALGRGLRGRRADQHSQSVLDAIHQFNMTMAEIKGHVVKRGKRNAIAQRFHAKHDKEAVASWKLGLGKILSVFETELSINADVNDNQRGALDIQTLPSPVNANASASASAIYRDVFNTHGDKHAKNLPTYASAPDESSPPLTRIAPRAISTDVRHDVVKTRSIVSQVQREVVDTHSIVTEIHQNVLKIRESNNHQSRTVTPGSNSRGDPVAINNYHNIIPRSGISGVVHWSIRIFYQAPSGAMLRAEYSNGLWSNFRHQDVVDATPSTPLACITWMGEKEIRLYYLDRQHILQEYCYSEGLGWFVGDVGKMNIRTSTNTRLSAVYFHDGEGGVNVCVYYQEPGSQAIAELRNDGGCWTKGDRLPDALDGTSIAAVALNLNGGVSTRVYYQAEDLSLKDHCYDSDRGWYPGEWNPGRVRGGSPINALAYEINEELYLRVCWHSQQDEIVTSVNTGSWGPITKVLGGVTSDFQFALVQWVDGKYIRLYYQDAGVVREHCSDDGGENWCPGHKWGASQKVKLQ